MSIVRIADRTQYTVISYRTLSDMSVSWEAKGLHSYLLSRPDDWVVYAKQLASVNASAGKNKIYRMINELVTAGYIYKNKLSTGEVEYIVFEQPQPPKNPKTVFGEQAKKTKGKAKVEAKNPKTVLGEQASHEKEQGLKNNPDPQNPDPQNPDPQNPPLLSNNFKANIDLKPTLFDIDPKNNDVEKIEVFRMHRDWEPERIPMIKLLARSNIPMDCLTVAVTTQFKAYWAGRDTELSQESWHGKLLNAVSYHFEKHWGGVQIA